MLQSVPTLAFAFVIAVLAAIAPGKAEDAAYPNQPVRVIVPFAAAGGTDLMARGLSQSLSDQWKIPVVVENRTGGNGDVGASYVSRARPDGYTLLLTTNAVVINPQLYPDEASFSPEKDFAPISLLGRLPFVLVVNPQLPITSLPQLIDYARAHPGKMNFGSSGAGGGAHLAAESLKSYLHLDMTHVPYKGAIPAILDVIAGHIDFMFVAIMDAWPFIESGKVRAIAVTSKTRNPKKPELRPVADYPGLANFEIDLWYGLLAPAQTPAGAVDKIYRGTVEAFKDNKVREHFEPYGVVLEAAPPRTFSDVIRNDVGKWRDVIAAAGLTGKLKP